MSTSSQTIRLYHPHGPDRVAVLSTQPSATQPDAYLIRLARGTGPGPLTQGTVYGPFPQAELDIRFAELLDHLKNEGFVPTGLHDLLLKLESPERAKRAKAALALGWRKATEAVEPILKAMPEAVDEVCSYLDALGMIGDARALPVLREQAARKLLSRRRSAVEALRIMDDGEGLAAASARALERLSASVRERLDANDAASLAQSVLELEKQHQGLALDTLYELATPLTVAAMLRLLDQISFDQPNIWRYVKSIHKRAMLRRDYRVFGQLSHAIERQGRSSTGTKATLKSGYDGVQRPVHLFSRKTQRYMRRLGWRYLRQVAAHRPQEYPQAAAAALIPYTPDDSEVPKGMYGRFASCYLLHRILWGASTRFVVNERSLRFRFQSADDVDRPTHAREESYAHLWDAHPAAYLRLLSAARLPEVHEFAVKAVESRHRSLMEQAIPDEILGFLTAPYEPTVALGLKELERRFDPANPDWSLLDRLLRDERSIARELGQRWLRLTAATWTTGLERIAAWLALADPATRSLVADLAIAALRENGDLRRSLAEHLWQLVRDSQVPADADGFVRVARETLLDELASFLSTQDLIDWIARGPVSTLALPAELLSRRPEAVHVLGLERLAHLAQHDLAPVRSAAHQLIRAAAAGFRDDPSLLLVLVESAWPDARALGVELLRATIRPETLGLDELTGLLDSNQVEVQDLGKDLARSRLSALPVEELVNRLVQHPHPNMRRFAHELVVAHLPEGVEPLRKLVQFFRTVLLELHPDRRLKQGVLDFLIQRGLKDEDQAAIASSILADIVRVEGRAEFEGALEGLVRLKLAYPELKSPLTLVMEEVA